MANLEILKFVNQIRAIDLSLDSWDLLILFFLGLGSILYAYFFVNRGKIMPILVSTYTAFVLVNFAPFLDPNLATKLGFPELYLLRLVAFALTFLVVLYILSRVLFQAPVGAETFGVFPSFLLALIQMGFLISVLVSYLPAEITNDFSEFVARLFVGTSALFYWAAASVFLLLIFGRKANKEVG